MGTSFAKHLSLWNAIFLSRCPPSMKSGLVQIAPETDPSWHLPDHSDGVGPSTRSSLHCPHHDTNPLLRIRHWAIFISFGDSRQNLYTTTTPCVKAEVYSNSAANNDFWHKQISQWKKLTQVYVINPNRSVNEKGWNSEFSRATGSGAPTIATPWVRLEFLN